MRELLTPEEVAEKLKVAPKTVRDWLRERKLRGLKLGNEWRVREEDLEVFLSISVAETSIEQGRTITHLLDACDRFHLDPQLCEHIRALVDNPTNFTLHLDDKQRAAFRLVENIVSRAEKRQEVPHAEWQSVRRQHAVLSLVIWWEAERGVFKGSVTPVSEMILRVANDDYRHAISESELEFQNSQRRLDGSRKSGSSYPK